MTEPSTPFDWQEVLAKLDGQPTDSPDLVPALAVAMRRVLSLVCAVPHYRRPADARRAGLRIYALVWLTDPSIIPGAPGLRDLARMIGCPIRTLSRLTGAYSKDLGIRNRVQRPASQQPRRAGRRTGRNRAGAPIGRGGSLDAPTGTQAPAVGNSKSNAIAR